MHFLYYK